MWRTPPVRAVSRCSRSPSVSLLAARIRWRTGWFPCCTSRRPSTYRLPAGPRRGEKQPGTDLPQEARDTENPYGFIGRDGALLELERALRRPPAGILIHGLGGVGKTTLARGFLQWLAMTNGLGQGCFWFSFQDIRSAEFVFNQLVAALFGTDAMAAPLDQKIEALIAAFGEHRFLVSYYPPARLSE